MRYHYTTIRMNKTQNTDNTKFWWRCGAIGTSFIAGGSAKLFGHFGRQFAVSNKTKHTLTTQSGNFTPWYLLKEVENLCPHKNLHTDAYGSFIHNCQNLEATKISFSRQMDKLLYIQTMEYLLFSATKKWAIKSWKDMEEPWMHIAMWKKNPLERAT